MRLLRSIFTPLVAIIAIQTLWVGLVASWIVWFVRNQRRLRDLTKKFGPMAMPSGVDLFILVEGLLLLVMLLGCMYVVFHLWRRQAALYHQQKVFIAQVTHELKSPLASLRLHLETVRLRRPSGARMDVFLDTMMGDTERLGNLIDNLLSANRLEQRDAKLHLVPLDFSALVAGYLRPQQFSLPRAGKMTLNLEEGIWIKGEAESLETVLRNLLENAILYSDAPPEIEVTLKRDGRQALLEFADQGRGIARKDLRRVFKMFYRARRKDENIRGTGLGLYIVETAVRLHGGVVWMESPGPGQGCVVHLRLPLLTGTAGQGGTP